MSKWAIRLLTLAISTAALVLVPTVTPANAETSSGHKKHQRHRSRGFIAPLSAGQPWRVRRPPDQPNAVCPGIARGIDCRVWPPPFDDDPDRKISGSDGG